MAVERLLIKNFAGLKEIDIEIKKINIYIGPQASGKSIIAKILFYCKGLIEEIFNQAMSLKTKRQLDEKLKNKFVEYFPVESWREQDFLIRYEINNDYVEIKPLKPAKKKWNISINYSDFYAKSFEKIKRKWQRETNNIDKSKDLDNMFIQLDQMMFFRMNYQELFFQQIADQFAPEYSFEQLFIPAGRSFFAHLEKNIFAMISQDNRLDPFLLAFGEYYELVKEHFELLFFRNNIKSKNSSSLLAIIDYFTNKIIVGKYIRLNGQDYLKMDDGRQVKLSYCSSGQQEALPLTIILKSICFLSLSKGGFRGKSVYLEEPEAHLFPTAQKDIVNLIAITYNCTADTTQFFITTHSPYILTAFNNLLQAGILKENFAKNKSKLKQLKKLSQLVPDHCVLNPHEVTVYSLSDGYCHNIIDPDTQLIDATIIDSVSQELAIQFDNLLDLE
jgi:predicted ATPase